MVNFANLSERQRKLLKTILVAVILCSVQLGFSGYSIVIKVYGQDIDLDPKLLIFIRTSFACLPACAFAVYMEGLPDATLLWPRVKWDILKLLLVSFLGIVMSPTCFVYGLYGTSPLFASLISQISPLMCVLFAVVLKQEPVPNLCSKMGALRILGFVLGISGAVFDIVMTIGLRTDKQKISIGVAALFAGICANSLYFVLQRKFFSNNPTSPWKSKPLTVHVTMFMLATFTSFLFFIYSFISGSFYKVLNTRALAPFSYATVVNALVCYMLLNWCNYYSSSSTVSASYTLQVVFSALLSWMLLGEKFFWFQGISAVTILSGLLLIVFTRPQDQSRQQADPILQNALSTASLF